MTALHYAVILENKKMIDILLEAGARYDIMDLSEETALSTANKEIKDHILNF